MVALVLVTTDSAGAGRTAPTILVVDDEPDIRHAVKGVLEATLKAKVLTASSADDALRILREANAINLIMTDFRMPGMNGVEFLERALEERPGTPAVLLTAFERELMEQTRGIHLANSVITKPISPRSMVQLVQRMLAEANT